MTGHGTEQRVEDYSHLSPTGLRLVARFRRTVTALVAAHDPASVLEVGCGQGWLLRDIATAVPRAALTGIDLRDEAVTLARTVVPGADLRMADAAHLPFGDAAFDVVVCSEVLEHVDDPEAVLAEIHRVGRGAVILSVPHEPWFWLANLARGKYLTTFGNFPGHIHHWTRGRFARLLRRGGDTVVVRAVFPWLVAHVTAPGPAIGLHERPGRR